MPTDSTGVFAVLTGDIIGSTELSVDRLEEARQALARAVGGVRRRRADVVAGEHEFFRGDAWQLLLADPGWALRTALMIRAGVRAELDVDTRVAIGVGVVDHVDLSRISLSTGEAFTLSGRALDNMTGYFDMTGAVPARAGVLARWLPVTLHLCSGLVRSWTRRQAEVVACALTLEKPTHEAIAKALEPPVKKQTVTDSLSGANWRTLQEPIDAFEQTDWLAVIGRPE
ncbi:MAG: hypothetical protein PVI23_16035 [Maricaulaceae bacterium]